MFEAAPGPPHLLVATLLENRLQADTAGVEIAARLVPVKAWRLDGSYSSFHVTPHRDPASNDAAALTFDGSAPAHQWQLGSTLWLRRTQINTTLFHTGALREFAVPAYTRADASVEVKLTSQVSVIAAGRNLLTATHIESNSPTIVSRYRLPRSAVQLVWRFLR